MKNLLRIGALTAILAVPSLPQTPQTTQDPAVKALIDRLTAAEARIRELEQKVGSSAPAAAAPAASAAAPAPAPAPAPAGPSMAMGLVPTTAAPVAESAAASVATPEPDDPHAHMEIPGGPRLNIRGFFDFNYGTGSIANPLQYPVLYNGCETCGNSPTPAHNGFQAGEFDLYITSKLSDHLNFVGEIVLGPDATNAFGLDIERYQLNYKANNYFSASFGRFHTAIGYYNTAYHHGNWFSTAEGRPIMYLFEDSGGVLPVHMVGASFTGEVPRTEELGLHWVAEVGNGNSSNPASINIQNFNSDRNYKSTNLAAYIRPKFASGLQIGGSWFHDGLNPTQASIPLPVAEIRQNVESAYVVYITGKWEFMNEGVMLSNHVTGMAKAYRSPMAYTQLSRKFGIYRPYFRYQYVRDNVNDPINILQGEFYGPSVGMRMDFSDYVALKVQYNHLYQSSQLPGNGANAQLAFTF